MRDWLALTLGPPLLQPHLAGKQEAKQFVPTAAWWIRQIVDPAWLPQDLEDKLLPVKEWYVTPAFKKVPRTRKDALVLRYRVRALDEYGREVTARVQLADMVLAFCATILVEEAPSRAATPEDQLTRLYAQTASMLRQSGLLGMVNWRTEKMAGGVGIAPRERFRSLAAICDHPIRWPPPQVGLTAWSNGTVSAIWIRKTRLPVGAVIPEQAMFDLPRNKAVASWLRKSDSVWFLDPYRWEMPEILDAKADQILRLAGASNALATRDGVPAVWLGESEIKRLTRDTHDKPRESVPSMRVRIQPHLLPGDLEKHIVPLSDASPWGKSFFVRYLVQGQPREFNSAAGHSGPAVAQIVSDSRLLRVTVGWPEALSEWARPRPTERWRCGAAVLMAALFQEPDNHSFLPYTLTTGEGMLRGEPKVEGLEYGLLDPKPVKDFWWGNIKFWTDGVTYYFECPA